MTMDDDQEEKQLRSLVELFCEITEEDPNDYGGFGVLSRSSIQSFENDSTFNKIWRHFIPMFNALSALDRIAIMHGRDLEYDFFVLPQNMTEKDLSLCASIYNEEIRKDPSFITGDPIEVKGVFDDVLLDSLAAHFKKS